MRRIQENLCLIQLWMLHPIGHKHDTYTMALRVIDSSYFHMSHSIVDATSNCTDMLTCMLACCIKNGFEVVLTNDATVIRPWQESTTGNPSNQSDLMFLILLFTDDTLSHIQRSGSDVMHGVDDVISGHIAGLQGTFNSQLALPFIVLLCRLIAFGEWEQYVCLP